MSLDLTNLSTTEQQFADVLTNAGMSLTDTAIKADWQALADAVNLPIANSSKYSPFWVFCGAAATAPVKFLAAFLVRKVMPNLYAKTATGAMLEIIAWAYDLTRKTGVKARGELIFTRNATSGAIAIAAGCSIRTVAINGTVYRVKTLAEVTIPAGTNSVRTTVEAEAIGAAYNLGAGYYSIIDSDLPGVGSVTNDSAWLTLPGADEETDDELRLRIRNQFTAVAEWHTDAKYKAMIAALSGFEIDRIFFDHNIPRGPGSADAYILFDAATTPDAYLALVNNYISTQGNHGHGDDMLVKALPTSTHNVTATVYFLANTTSAVKTARLAEIEQFIRCAFRQNSNYAAKVTQTWPYSRFSFSLLDYELHKNFAELAAVTWGQADIISNLDVPRLGTLTITEGA